MQTEAYTQTVGWLGMRIEGCTQTPGSTESRADTLAVGFLATRIESHNLIAGWLETMTEDGSQTVGRPGMQTAGCMRTRD
jgi:hypothetical protein